MRGPLARVSTELDSAYYGTAAYNRRVILEHAVSVLFAGMRQMGLLPYGPLVPTPEEDEARLQRPRPKLQNTYHWINKLHHLEEPHTLGQMAGWENFSAWRLDVLLGLAELPVSRWRIFALYMDGYTRSEIAELMAPEDGEAWDDESIRSVLKECSRQIRRKAEMNLPSKKQQARPGATPTTAIKDVERLIAQTRSEQPRMALKRRLRLIKGVGERQVERRRERRQKAA